MELYQMCESEGSITWESWQNNTSVVEDISEMICTLKKCCQSKDTVPFAALADPGMSSNFASNKHLKFPRWTTGISIHKLAQSFLYSPCSSHGILCLFVWSCLAQKCDIGPVQVPPVEPPDFSSVSGLFQYAPEARSEGRKVGSDRVTERLLSCKRGQMSFSRKMDGHLFWQCGGWPCRSIITLLLLNSRKPHALFALGDRFQSLFHCWPLIPHESS